MAKDPYAGLERTIVELPFTDGLANNFAKHFRAAPKDALYAIDNADLTSVGKFSNRDGFVSLSNARIGAEAGFASLIGSHKKLFQHKDELGVIADTNFPIGSGAGWGGTGDTVYTFIPDTPAPSATGAWKAHGKIPRPTLSCVSDITSDTEPTISDVAVAGKFAIIAWHSAIQNLAPPNGTGADYGGLWFKVIDITNDASVIDTTLAPTPTGILAEATDPPGGGVAGRRYQAKINCLAIGNILYCFYIGAVAGVGVLNGNSVCVFTIDMSAANPVAGNAAILATGVVNYSVCTDGASIYLAYLSSATPTRGNLKKFNSAFAVLLGPVNTHDYVGIGTIVDFTIDTNAGEVAIATVVTVVPDVRRLLFLEAFSTTALAVTTASGGIADSLTNTPTTNIQRGPFYNPDVIVLASGQYAAGVNMKTRGDTYGQFFWCFSFRSAGVASAPTANYVAGGVWATGKMIRINGRTYVPALRCDVAPNAQIGSELGYFLLELDTTQPANATDLYRTPLVTANWATDVAACVVDANNIAGIGGFTLNQIPLPRGCVAGNTYYITTRKGASLGTSSFPFFDTFTLELLKFNFADPYRWASRIYGDITAFAGGAMFAYDGRRTYECGILTRPRVLSAVERSTTGTFLVAQEYFVRLVYTWLDNTGQRWFSAPSYANRTGDGFNFTLLSAGHSVLLEITTPPPFTGMCSGIDFFANAVEIWIYMTNPAAATGVYYLTAKVGVADAIANNFTPGYSPVSGSGTVQVPILNPPPFTSDQLYTVGGELENSPAPACRTIEAHRDRLFAISSYDNNVYYTKPKVAGRGVEWCQQTLRIPLTETGLGLASNETCLMIFTNRGVYAVEGYGPSATGQPVQAFGTLQLISNQLGLYEVNSCLSTPVGVIFRTSYGWYLVDRSLSISFIGNDINGMTALGDTTIALSVEQSKSVIRILTQRAGATTGFVAYNYWYDSKRWSTDSSLSPNTYKDAITFKETYCMIDSNDVLARQGANFGGSSWNDGAADAFGHGIRVETGWITVANMAMYKRIWRVIATVENLTPGDPQNPLLNLAVYADWSDVAIVSHNFTADQIGQGVQTIRAHLPVQKMKAIRIVLQQVPVTASQTYTNNPGYNFIGLGFEIGLKNRTSPEGAARST